MTIDLTGIVLAVISLIGALITRYLIPWIKEKTNEKQFEALKILAKVGVYAAEQLFSTEQWKEKKQYVLDFLKKNGYEVDAPAVDALIESLVRELQIEQGEQRDSGKAKVQA